VNLSGELRYYLSHLNDQVKGAQMRKYKQFTRDQRYQIYGLNQADLNQTQISQKIGVHNYTRVQANQRPAWMAAKTGAIVVL
jgi:hypothetical protein